MRKREKFASKQMGIFFGLIRNTSSSIPRYNRAMGKAILPKLIFIVGIVSLFTLSSGHSETAQIPPPAPVTMGHDSKIFLQTTLLSGCKKTDPTFNAILKEFESKIGDESLSETYSTMLYESLSRQQCDPSHILQFKKLIAKDRLPAHLENLEKIKTEIFNFRKKRLGASILFAKYFNYPKENFLDTQIASDPKIVRLYQESKNEFQNRSKTCTDRTNIKPPLSLDRPKDQDSTGWCYAYATSDLVAHAIGKEPSAIHLANLVNNKFFQRLREDTRGGWINEAIEELKSEGICLEKDLPSTDYRFATKDYKLQSVFEEVIKMSKQYHALKAKPKSFSPDDITSELCSKRQNLLVGLKEIFPQTTLEQISNILIHTDGIDAFLAMAKQSCTPKKDKDLQSIKLKTQSFKHKIFPTIDEQLSRGNIVGIHYKGSVLTDYQKETKDVTHASTIVGRRFNTKTMSCEYLLRNSWGKPCIYYSSEYECKDGHIWIAEDYFKYNDTIDEVVYLEKN